MKYKRYLLTDKERDQRDKEIYRQMTEKGGQEVLFKLVVKYKLTPARIYQIVKEQEYFKK
jgi:Mor family transcriptional regulator